MLKIYTKYQIILPSRSWEWSIYRAITWPNTVITTEAKQDRNARRDLHFILFLSLAQINVIFWDNAWLFQLYPKKLSGLTDGQSCQAIYSFLRGVYINLGEILNSDWLKSYIYFPYMPTQLISKNGKKQEILWYELVHNYIPFLLKTSKGTRNFIRSMTLYVSMLFYPLYEVAKRCDCKIKFFHDPTVLLLWHPIQPPPKQHFQAGNKIIFIKYLYYRSWVIFQKFK